MTSIETREKNELIFQRERLRAKLQIDNALRLLKDLKKDIDMRQGAGLSLPGAENQMNKIGATCRKLQKVQFDPSFKPDETDQEKTLDQITEEIEQIENEIGDPWPSNEAIARKVQKRYHSQILADKVHKENYKNIDLEKEMIKDGILTDPEPDIDKETEEIEKIETELKDEEDTKTW